MKSLEKILAVLIPIFILLKLILVPTSSVLLAISIILLSLIYYPFGFAFFNNIRLRNIFKKESYKEVTALHIIGAIAIGLALSHICVGILFKILDYSLANTFLIAGLISTFIILLIGLVRYLKSKSHYYVFMFIRIAIISVSGIVFLII